MFSFLFFFIFFLFFIFFFFFFFMFSYLSFFFFFFFFFSSRRRHTRSLRDWSSDVCSSDLSSIRRSTRLLIPPNSSPRTGDPVSNSYFSCASLHHARVSLRRVTARSEERRVGKECRSRWSPDDEKKKKERIENERSSMRMVR